MSVYRYQKTQTFHEEKKDTSKVEIPNLEVSDVENDFKDEVDSVVMKPEGTLYKAEVVNCKKLNVREEPSLKSKIINVLDAGDIVNVFVTFEQESKILKNKGLLVDDFYKISFADNLTSGFCMSDYLQVLL